jgi:hypothetical protein
VSSVLRAAEDCNAEAMKGRPSFLKKRSKKLLIPAAMASSFRVPGRKSLLLLFFRKEVLASYGICRR